MVLLSLHAKLKKQKKKPTKADLEAQAAFEKLQRKWDKMYGKVTMEKRRPAEIPKLVAPPGRESKRLPSLVTPGASTAPRKSQQYSGTKMLGVGQMHKSNAVPVFQQRTLWALRGCGDDPRTLTAYNRDGETKCLVMNN